MGDQRPLRLLRHLMTLVVALVAVVASGCGASGGSSLRAADAASTSPSRIKLFAAPLRMATQCRRAQRHVTFVVLCPTAMPHARDGTQPATFAQWADYPKAVTAKWLYAGGTYGGSETDPQDWSGNSPDVFFHFFVFEGQLTAQLLNLRGVPHPQVFLGRRQLGGHTGNLYKQVSYSLCSECSFTGHVTFIWKERGVTYAASLHRWSLQPSSQELNLLSDLIEHLRPSTR